MHLAAGAQVEHLAKSRVVVTWLCFASTCQAALSAGTASTARFEPELLGFAASAGAATSRRSCHIVTWPLESATRIPSPACVQSRATGAAGSLAAAVLSTSGFGAVG